MQDNYIDTPEDLDRQLQAAQTALADFEDNVDRARLMLRLRTASPAHPLLLIRFLFGATATACVIFAVIVLATTALSTELARALMRFESVIPVPEEIPALPAVLGLIAVFFGFAWLTATLAAYSLGRDAPMLPWEQKQHQKLLNEVTRLTTQKAVIERIKNTPAGARPRIATPVPVTHRRSLPASTTGGGARPTPGPSGTPSSRPTPAGASAGGFGPSRAPSRPPAGGYTVGSASPPTAERPASAAPSIPPSAGSLPVASLPLTRPGVVAPSRTAPTGAGRGVPGGFGARAPGGKPTPTATGSSAPRPAMDTRSRPGGLPTEPPVARGDLQDTTQTEPMVRPRADGRAPRPEDTPSSARTPVAGWAAAAATPSADSAETARPTAPRRAEVAERSEVGRLPRVAPSTADGMRSPDAPRADAVVARPVDAGPPSLPPVSAAVVLEDDPPVEAVAEWDETSDTNVMAPPRARPSIVMPAFTPPPAPSATNGAAAHGSGRDGGVRLGSVSGAVAVTAREDDEETLEDPSSTVPRADGILGKVRAGAITVGRSTPYGSAGRVRLPPPAATVRLGAADAALGQSTRGGTPLGAAPKAGLPVGRARPRSPTPVPAERGATPPRPTPVQRASDPVGAFPATPDAGPDRGGTPRDGSDDPTPAGRSDTADPSMFGTPLPMGRAPSSAVVSLVQDEDSDDLEAPTVVPSRATGLARGPEVDPWLREAVAKAEQLKRSFPPPTGIELWVKEQVPFSLRITSASPALAVRAMVNFVEFLANVPTPPRAMILLDAGSQIDRSFHKNVEAALEPYFQGRVDVVPGVGEVSLRFHAPDARWARWPRAPM